MSVTTTTTIDHHNNILELRGFNEVENDVMPLMLHKDPKIYTHSTCFFLVDKQHPHYASLRKMIELWLDKVQPGGTLTIDALQGKYNLTEELEKRKWYVVDLRREPDTWPNEVRLKNLTGAAGVPEWLIQQYAQNIYRSVKSLVVFADTLDDVPKCWRTYALWGLTASSTVYDLRHICMSGTSHTPSDVEAHCGFISAVGAGAATPQPSLLRGFHKFNEMPSFVYWPCW